jgi:N,N'-diacetyllegionaminate synthase
VEITLPSGRKIGPGHPTFIVAEVGSNWRNLEDSLHSIAMANAAGADAVKFQAFNYKALYGLEGQWIQKESYSSVYGVEQVTVPAAPEFDRRALPLDWLPKLKEKADACGIELMCTAFSPELVDEVDRYVSIHKVASAELSHVRILERLRDKGKLVILSTGASGKADIQQAIRVLRECTDDTYDHERCDRNEVDVILLYCVAAYPARDVDFRMLEALKDFGCPVGYSDHTTDISVIPKTAVDLGACVIEKHFTDIPEVETPDRPHSLTVDEFKKMVETIRGTREFTWGNGEERDMLLRHNRRLVATRRIQAGETLSEIPPHANFGIYRSLKEDSRGLLPFAIGRVIGRLATRDIEAGEAIGPGDFE